MLMLPIRTSVKYEWDDHGSEDQNEIDDLDNTVRKKHGKLLVSITLGNCYFSASYKL